MRQTSTCPRKDDKNKHSKRLTISRQKKFPVSTKSKVFPSKDKCLCYIKSHPSLYLFSEDKTATGNKRFIASTREYIYNALQDPPSWLYENIEKDQPVKLHLDIDLKSKNIPKGVNEMAYFKQVLTVSLALVEEELLKYKANNPKTQTKEK